jgi:uncharacterized protein
VFPVSSSWGTIQNLSVNHSDNTKTDHVAIIGSGIAGMGCAYYLRDCARLTLYEREPRIGGHTHTVEVEEAGKRIPIDTGFMVFNRATYPNILRLFAELGVEHVPTDMSFGVHRPDARFFWSSRAPLARPANLIAPQFWKMIRDARRFNREARQMLSEGILDPRLSVGEWAKQRGYSRAFLDYYLLPMSGAIWSTPPENMEAFPILSLIQFFANHALLGFSGHHKWFTLRGGSQAYRDRLMAQFKGKCQTQCAAVSLERLRGGGVAVTSIDGETHLYDKAILACHADEALSLLVDPTDREKELLGAFAYSRNDVLLHTCEDVMPPSRKAWAAWNFRYDRHPSSEGLHGSTHYWMNLLQPLAEYGARRQYFVSVNDSGMVPEEAVLRRMVYTHPMFDAAAVKAREELPQLNEKGPVYFCGSYFRHGFHEDGLLSALHVVRQVRSDGGAPDIRLTDALVA